MDRVNPREQRRRAKKSAPEMGEGSFGFQDADAIDGHPGQHEQQACEEPEHADFGDRHGLHKDLGDSKHPGQQGDSNQHPENTENI